MSAARSRLLQTFDALSPSEQLAVLDSSGAERFDRLSGRARELASRLGAAGLRGTRVALLAEPGRDWVEAFWAILLAGGTVVPLSVLQPAAERRRLLSQSGARALLMSEGLANTERAHHPECAVFSAGRLDAAAAPSTSSRGALIDGARSAELETALLLYTSGTTGRPKGVPLSHANLFEGARTLIEAWGLAPEDRLLHALPLHHLHGICAAFLSTYLAGGSTSFLPRFSAEAVIAAIPGASVLMGVPTQHQRLCDHLDALDGAARRELTVAFGCLRLVTSGSAKLPEKLGRRLEALFGQYPLERYGMTEVGIVLANPLHGPRVPGSVGLPLPGCEIRVVDEACQDAGDDQPGELWIRGASVFSGYDADPEATEQAFSAGFFKSGDTVARSRDGSIRILGRTSVDIIKSGGYKLSAIEIEEQLRAHVWIDDLAVVGIPDEEWGERVVAVITPTALGRAALERDRRRAEAELAVWSKRHIASYQVPKAFEWWSELPRNGLGKVQKKEILARLTRTSPAE